MREYFHSLSEMGRSMGCTPKKRREKEFACRKCGGKMTTIRGTNVAICENENKDGKVCGNRVMTGFVF